MKWFAKYFCLLAALLLLLPSGSSQSRKELEKRRKQQQEDIKKAQKVLSEVKTKQKQSLEELTTLSRQISLREEVIITVNSEIALIDEQLTQAEEDLGALQQQLIDLRKEYAAMIKDAYKRRNAYDKLMFIFAADNFNQAVQRLRFLQHFGRFREQQVKEINQTQVNITARKLELADIRNEKLGLVTVKEAEKQELESDKKEEERLLITLKSKEKQIRKELKKKEAALKKLDRAIQSLIAAEIEAQRKKAQKEAAAKAAKTGTTTTAAEKKEVTLTPEAQALSNDFAGNQRKLPWPVEAGYISSTFGVREHPSLKGVRIENNGIDITTRAGASARTIFKGEVRAIFTIPGLENAVLVSHGEYFTVYCNLSNVTVKKGDKVNAKTTLGTIHTNAETGKTDLHFEVWKGTTKMNPENWILPR